MRLTGFDGLRRQAVPCLWLWLLPLLLAGCGGTTQQSSPQGFATARQGKALRTQVVVESVFKAAQVPDGVDAAVLRQVGLECQQMLADSGVFDVLEKRTMAPRPANDEWSLSIEVVALREISGATFKLGPVSSQKQRAVATVKARLSSLGSGRHYESVHQGESSKGAWGVVSEVNRESMNRREGFWKLDETMAGNACRSALQQCVADLAAHVESAH